jgi:aryl-alcohol dehydrogenase (NADP+)
MKYNRLGDSELNVSEITLGTMTFGEQNTQAEAHQQLDFAVSQGINFIDTAEMYPVPPRAETQGYTEQYIGQWLKHQQRDKLIIASKVTGPARGYDWIRGGPRISGEHIEQAVEQSLERLQTDYIDLYQVHWPDRNVPMFGQRHFEPGNEREAISIAEQLDALAAMIQSGKVRYIGLSNETPWGLGQFVKLAEELNLPRVVSLQNAYNLLNRSLENGLSEVIYRENIGLLAYSPLAFGLLSGKYRVPGGSGRVSIFPGFAQRYSKQNVNEAVDEYCALAERAGLSAAAMALAFVRQRWFVTSTIIGATSLQQLQQDIDSVGVDLSEELQQDIEKIYQRFPDPAP